MGFMNIWVLSFVEWCIKILKVDLYIPENQNRNYYETIAGVPYESRGIFVTYI